MTPRTPGDPGGVPPFHADPAPVRVRVPSGWWRFLPASDTDGTATFTAQLMRQRSTTVSTVEATVVRPSVCALEEALGFPLPRAVHAALDVSLPRDDLVLAEPSGDWQLASGKLLLDFGLDLGERPWRVSEVALGSSEWESYGRLLHADPPLRTWQDDVYRVDIIAITDSSSAPDDGYTLSYRICLQDTRVPDEHVVFAGDDAVLPTGSDPRSDDAIREVIHQVVFRERDPRRLSYAQQSFLQAHRDRLAVRTLGRTPPFTAGTRIQVDLANGLTATGTIRESAQRGGQTAGYLWRPDVADLPGHPGRRDPDYLLYAEARRVRHTLEARDTAVHGPHGPVVLTFAATIATIDDPRFGRGWVLRAVDADGQLAYDIEPDGEPGTCIRLDAREVIALTGTAWPTVDRILLAREAAGVPLIPGEILVAVREIALMPHALPPTTAALVRHDLHSPDQVLDPALAPHAELSERITFLQATDHPHLPPASSPPAGLSGELPRPRPPTSPEPPDMPGIGPMDLDP